MQQRNDPFVEALFVKGERHIVNRVDVERGDNVAFLDVTEERNLGTEIVRQRTIRPAQKNVG
jgi:hypothetical protein